MSDHSEVYERIRKQIEKWPQWKIDVYNECFATSEHSEKIVRAKPTNADRISSMTLEEKVAFLCVDNCNYCAFWNAKLEHCTDQKSKKKPITLGCAEGHRRYLEQEAPNA